MPPIPEQTGNNLRPDAMNRRRASRDETLSKPQLVLDAMGNCRRALTDAQGTVRPMGAAYHACAMVTAAIDTLAYYITGVPHYYSIGGSAPTPGVPEASPGFRNWHEDRLRRGGPGS